MAEQPRLPLFGRVDTTVLQLEALQEALSLLGKLRTSERLPKAETARVEAFVAAALRKRPSDAPAAPPIAADATFTLIVTREGEQLVESKAGGNTVPHFRCSRGLYYAVAAVFARADHPLSMDEISALAAAELDDWPSHRKIYLLLKFWLAVTPPLIVRRKGRYAASDADDILITAVEHWVRLRAGIPTASMPRAEQDREPLS